MASGDEPSGRERRAALGDMLDQTGRPMYGPRRYNALRARAEAAEAAKLAGYKSPWRRLIDRLLRR